MLRFDEHSAAAGAGIVCTDDVPGLVDALTRWNGYSAESRLACSKQALSCFETHFRAERVALKFFDRVTAEIADAWGLECRLLPMTDDRVPTRITATTDAGGKLAAEPSIHGRKKSKS